MATETCTMCSDSIKEKNDMVENAAREAPADRRYILEWYAREPRDICMECYILHSLMIQEACQSSSPTPNKENRR